MAIYPCSWAPHRYPEPQQSAYFIAPRGTAVEGSAMRLCPKHFREYETIVQEHVAVLNDETEVTYSCESCGAERGDAVFIRIFPAKADERVYGANLCQTCYETLHALLRVSNGRPLTAR